MAEVNPNLQQDNTPNFLRYSEGYRAAKPSDGLATLFEDISSGLGAAVKGIDDVIKLDIEETLRSDVDTVRKEFGIEQATLFDTTVSSNTKQPAPQDLQRAGNDLERLKKAYVNGTLKESHYWARLNSSVRQMRARWPSHADYIDNTISSITGGIPANRVRQELQQEAAELKAKQQASAREGKQNYERLFFTALNSGSLPVDFNQRKASGKPYGFDELAEAVAIKERNKADLEIQTKRLNLVNAKDQAEQEKATDIARRSVFTRIGEITNANTKGTLGHDWSTFQTNLKSLQEKRGGVPLSGEELNQVRTQWGNLRSQIETIANQALAEDFAPNTSFLKVLDNKNVQDIRDNVKSYLDTYDKALTDQNFGLLGSLTNRTQAVIESDKYKVLTTSNALRRMTLAKDMLGDAGSSLILTQPSNLNEIQKALQDYVVTNAVTEGAPLREEFRKHDKQSNEYYKQTTDNLLSVVKDSKASKEATTNVAQSLFGQGNLKLIEDFSVPEKLNVFEKFTEPAIATNLYNLSKKTGGQEWNNYKNWTQLTFQAVYSSLIDEMNSIQANRPFVDVTFDKDRVAFKMVAKPQPKNTLTGLFDQQPEMYARRSIDKLNRAINRLAQVYILDKEDAGEEVQKIILEKGFNPQTPKDKGIRFYSLVNAIEDSLVGTPEFRKERQDRRNKFLETLTPDQRLMLYDGDMPDLTEEQQKKIKEILGE